MQVTDPDRKKKMMMKPMMIIAIFSVDQKSSQQSLTYFVCIEAQIDWKKMKKRRETWEQGRSSLCPLLLAAVSDIDLPHAGT